LYNKLAIILPQMMARVLDDPQVLNGRYARIVRIAIEPALQRQGLGTKLFKKTRDFLSADCSHIGTSFGADKQTVSFWLKAGLLPVHYGHKLNPRSGQRSACFVTTINQQEHIEQQKQILLANRFLYLHLAAIKQISTNEDDVVALLCQQPAQSSELDGGVTEDLANKHIQRFCDNKRSFADTVGFFALLDKTRNNAEIQTLLDQLIRDQSALRPKQQREYEQQLRECLNRVA